MHLTQDMMRGMTVPQRQLMERLNTEQTILRRQLLDLEECPHPDCKKSPNIRSTLLSDPLDHEQKVHALENQIVMLLDSRDSLRRALNDITREVHSFVQIVRDHVAAGSLFLTGDEVIEHTRELLSALHRVAKVQ